MLINYLIAVTLRFNSCLDLKELVSPPLLYYEVRHSNIDAYRTLLKSCSQALEEFKALPEQDQLRVVRKWYESIELKHRRLQDGGSRARLAKLNAVDVSKVDLLLVATGRDSVFEDKQYVISLYNLIQCSKSNYCIEWNLIDWPSSHCRTLFQSGVSHSFEVFSFEKEHKSAMVRFAKLVGVVPPAKK